MPLYEKSEVTLDSFPADKNKPVSALAFDFGTQRIGVAYGQSLTGTAEAITVLKAKNGIPDWDAVQALIIEWQPNLFVVGLPYNLDGTKSELLPRAIKFGNRLNGRFHKPIYGMDERLSSRAASERLANTSERQNKRTFIDDIAAQIILENWLTELRGL